MRVHEIDYTVEQKEPRWKSETRSAAPYNDESGTALRGAKEENRIYVRFQSESGGFCSSGEYPEQ